MLVATTWKARPLSPAQANRMMETWAKIEAQTAENTSIERLSWYIAADGSSGVTLDKVNDPDAAAAFQLEISLALSEFLELESKVVLDLDTAMLAILKGMEHVNGWAPPTLPGTATRVARRGSRAQRGSQMTSGMSRSVRCWYPA
jgi:hypothetical protein